MGLLKYGDGLQILKLLRCRVYLKRRNIKTWGWRTGKTKHKTKQPETGT